MRYFGRRGFSSSKSQWRVAIGAASVSRNCYRARALLVADSLGNSVRQFLTNTSSSSTAIVVATSCASKQVSRAAEGNVSSKSRAMVVPKWLALGTICRVTPHRSSVDQQCSSLKDPLNAQGLIRCFKPGNKRGEKQLKLRQQRVSQIIANGTASLLHLAGESSTDPFQTVHCARLASVPDISNLR